MSEQRTPVAIWTNLLEQGLRDDGWPFDWTTRATIQKPSHRMDDVEMVAKSEGVWGAPGLVEATIRIADLIGGKLAIDSHIEAGQEFHGGNAMMHWSGISETMLQLERPFLNLAAYASGIASATYRLTQKVKRQAAKAGVAKPPRVAGTRKILPHYQAVAIEAVMAGGGAPHRPGLASGVLIKENHVRSGGGIARVVDRCLRQSPHLHRIEVEVTSFDEAKEALKAGADVLMLDNFSPERAQDVIDWIRGESEKVWIEMSGGINEANIERFVLDGVDVISVGSITHSVIASDFSLLFPKG